MYETVGDAITEVAGLVGLTNGQGMTPYSPDLVRSYLVSAHALIRGSAEWDEMVQWYPRTLDGTIGKITQLIPDIKDWKRIRRIYHESFQTPLALLSSYSNPLTSTLLCGFRPLAPPDDNTVGTGRYLVQFYPATLTGNVLFQIEREIDWTNSEEVIPIDFWWHVWTAAWFWATGDGGNAAQAQQFLQLITERKKQVNADQSSRHSWAQPNQMTPNDWWEQDAPYS